MHPTLPPDRATFRVKSGKGRAVAGAWLSVNMAESWGPASWAGEVDTVHPGSAFCRWVRTLVPKPPKPVGTALYWRVQVAGVTSSQMSVQTQVCVTAGALLSCCLSTAGSCVEGQELVPVGAVGGHGSCSGEPPAAALAKETGHLGRACAHTCLCVCLHASVCPCAQSLPSKSVATLSTAII